MQHHKNLITKPFRVALLRNTFCKNTKKYRWHKLSSKKRNFAKKYGTA